MKPIPEFQELTITLLAKEIVPAFLTSKFLRESRIVPKEWEFVRPPEIDAQSAKVAFTNDVLISARPGAIAFSENLNDKNILDFRIPSLIFKWMKTLHKFDYQAIEIEPTVFSLLRKRMQRFFGTTFQLLYSLLVCGSQLVSSQLEPALI